MKSVVQETFEEECENDPWKNVEMSVRSSIHKPKTRKKKGKKRKKSSSIRG